jgi:hypothetical protein
MVIKGEGRDGEYTFIFGECWGGDKGLAWKGFKLRGV